MNLHTKKTKKNLGVAENYMPIWQISAHPSTHPPSSALFVIVQSSLLQIVIIFMKPEKKSFSAFQKQTCLDKSYLQIKPLTMTLLLELSNHFIIYN